MSEYSIPLGNSVKDARKKIDLSQNEVAHQAAIDVRTIINIEKYRGNPKMQVLSPLVRTLKMDANEIFYPERKRSTPALSQLRLMIEDCSEEEAEKLIPVFEAVLSAMRSSEATKIE